MKLVLFRIFCGNHIIPHIISLNDIHKDGLKIANTLFVLTETEKYFALSGDGISILVSQLNHAIKHVSQIWGEYGKVQPLTIVVEKQLS